MGLFRHFVFLCILHHEHFIADILHIELFPSNFDHFPLNGKHKTKPTVQGAAIFFGEDEKCPL